MPAGGSPENITIVFLSPSKVQVSWTTAVDAVEKYDVTYKPTDARSATCRLAWKIDNVKYLS